MTTTADRGPSRDDDPGTRAGLTRRRFMTASALAGAATVTVPLAGCAPAAPPPAPAANPAPTDSVVTLTVNGEPRRVAVDTRTSLLDMLRERLELTGTKKGCNQGGAGPARSCSTAGASTPA